MEIGKQIKALRQRRGITQEAMAQHLNITPQAISKWERADAVPDAFVLKKIAAVFNVTVDYLLNEHSPDEKIVVEKPRTYSRTVISVITMIGIWTLALVAFVVTWLCRVPTPLIFAYTIPVSLIVLLVLNSVWGIGKLNMFIISGIVWGLITCVYLTFYQENWWQLFIIGFPAQIIIILSFYIKKNRKKD